MAKKKKRAAAMALETGTEGTEVVGPLPKPEAGAKPKKKRRIKNSSVTETEVPQVPDTEVREHPKNTENDMLLALKPPRGKKKKAGRMEKLLQSVYQQHLATAKENELVKGNDEDEDGKDEDGKDEDEDVKEMKRA